MNSIEEDKVPSLDSTSKYLTAIQITRPKSASKTGNKNSFHETSRKSLLITLNFRCPQDHSLATHQ